MKSIVDTYVPSADQLQAAFRMARVAQHFWAVIAEDPEIYFFMNYLELAQKAIALREVNKDGQPGFVKFELVEGTTNDVILSHHGQNFYWSIDFEGIISVGVHGEPVKRRSPLPSPLFGQVGVRRFAVGENNPVGVLARKIAPNGLLALAKTQLGL